MLNGLRVLGSLDGAADGAMTQVGALDKDIAAMTDELVRLQGEQTQAYQSLARLRMRELGDSRALDDLTAAERKARSLLAERAAEHTRLDDEIKGLEAELASQTAERDTAVAEAERKTGALEQAERAALEALQASDAYTAQMTAAEKAETIARHAEQKRTFAEEDRIAKGKAYEDDPLFLYLWRRGFGTPRYAGGFLARYVDAKVARLIDFDKARANYAMLVEIPERLGEHAERRRAMADEAARHVAEMETAALETDAVVAARGEADHAQARLDAVEERVEALRGRRLALTAERAMLASGEDAKTREARDVVAAALTRRDLQDLRRDAQRTPTPDDDTLVDRIDDLEAAIAEVQARLDERKTLLADQRKRIAEMEQVRNEYRRRGVGGDRFDFADGASLAVLLGQVLGGGMSSGGLSDQLGRRRRPRSPGGLGGGFRIGGRGGFGTGGGFGGGGFRTGGGF